MIGLTLAAALFAMATPAVVTQAGPHVLVAGPVVSRPLTYGPEPRQGLVLFTREAAGRAPLIVYLHGGGWSAGSPKDGANGAQAEHWTSRGYAYATVGYSFVPGATAEQQLQDVAGAIAFLRRQKHVDPDRIVLVGHSSGGTMAATIGADPHWLAAAGVPFSAVKAVVLLDPAVLDLAPIMTLAGDPTVERYLRPAFGDDPTRWSALSPMRQVEAPNAPAWLILADANNRFAQDQGGSFLAGLTGAGIRDAALLPIAGTTHMRLNGEIGRAGDIATQAVDAFLARALPDAPRSRLR